MGRKDKKKKKLSLGKKILIGLGSIILVLAIGLTAGYMYVRNSIYSGEKIEKNDRDFEEVDGITNILLIGTDARNLDEPSRSDSIMILTIDNNTKKLKLTSIMRDTFVNIPGHGQGKINAAMSNGGVKLLIETINETFGMNLNKYLMVNFWGFESIIDILGGIEVDIKDYEINQLNKYIGEQHKEKSPKILHPGVQLLDGQQALSYARIRKTGNGDYERTDRQRRVLGIIAEKFKDVSPLKYPSFMTKLLPHIKTNVEPVELLNYAYTASKFPSLDFEQMRLPIEDISREANYKQYGAVLLIDKEQHKKALNDFIFKDIKPTKETYSISQWQRTINSEYYGYTPSSNINNNNSNHVVKPPLENVTPPSGNVDSGNNGSGEEQVPDVGNPTPPPTEPTPPVEPEKPVVPPTPVEPEKPVVPPAPVEPEKPVTPPVEPEKPVNPQTPSTEQGAETQVESNVA